MTSCLSPVSLSRTVPKGEGSKDRPSQPGSQHLPVPMAPPPESPPRMPGPPVTASWPGIGAFEAVPQRWWQAVGCRRQEESRERGPCLSLVAGSVVGTAAASMAPEFPLLFELLTLVCTLLRALATQGKPSLRLPLRSPRPQKAQYPPPGDAPSWEGGGLGTLSMTSPPSPPPHCWCRLGAESPRLWSFSLPKCLGDSLFRN